MTPEQAAGKVITYYRTYILKICWKYFRGEVRNAMSSEDVLQNVNLKIFENREKLKDIEDLSAWVGTIAVHEATGAYRKAKTHQWDKTDPLGASESGRRALDIPAQGMSPEEIAIQNINSAAVRRALGEMKNKAHRDAVFLRDIEGLSYEEAAKRLRIPSGSVKSRVFRGRSELRDNLRQAQKFSEFAEEKRKGTGA